MDEQAAKKLVQAVVQAENTAGDTGRKQADDLLSIHFIRLTRGGKPERGEQAIQKQGGSRWATSTSTTTTTIRRNHPAS
jgi:hypothetical protein